MLYEVHRLLPLLVSLAGKAANDIRRNHHAWHSLEQGIAHFSKLFNRVFTLHGVQHRV